MGILDEAIKEHLELKRQHGAGESELQQLEDEAFGAAERPGDEEPQSDAHAEAPTEFMTQPEVPEADAGEGSGQRRPAPQVADLQEAPPLEPEPPAEEEAPAMEHEAVPEPAAEPEPPAGPSTEERHAIAEQPTEMFDVEEELAASDPAAPSEEELVEEATAEPRLAPVDPLADIEEPVDESAEIQVEEVAEDADELDDEFWDEKRLSDELDQALEAPRDSEPEEPEAPDGEAEPEEAESGDEPTSEQPSPSRDEDVLEETPDFLEEAPEDDQLWFEQKPPKDFDFDD
ncbi:MAG TPA: hypothetical protein VNP96_05410 [Solirubrobacterales bacterium]|nr:hypothetical protein [Solirubrobacterales bacterium]